MESHGIDAVRVTTQALDEFAGAARPSNIVDICIAVSGSGSKEEARMDGGHGRPLWLSSCAPPLRFLIRKRVDDRSVGPS